MTGARVLVVDDEPAMRHALVLGLGHAGYDVRTAADGEDGLQQAAAWRPDVILLDLGLPGLSGFEVLERTRRHGDRAAIVVVSVMPDQSDKVRALELGADDYVVKPFGMDELLARIRAVLRRQAALPSGDPVLTAGDLRIDLTTRRVTAAGIEIALTPTEYEVLRVLAINAGRPVTHVQLLRDVWGPHAVHDTYNTRYVVAQIRRKLDDDPARPRYIASLPGVGYRLLTTDGG